MEQTSNGVTIVAPLTNKICKRLAIAFIDDTVLASNRITASTKIQSNMTKYIDTYEVLAGKVSKEKIVHYS